MLKTFTGVKYTRIAETFSVKAETEEEAKELVRNGECDIEDTDSEDGDGDVEFDIDEEQEENNPTDTGEDEQAYLAKIAPYQQRAKDEKLEVTFHVFADNGRDGWPDDPLEALKRYREFVQEGLSSRLWVELYRDRANDDMELEDHILGFGPYPS